MDNVGSSAFFRVYTRRQHPKYGLPGMEASDAMHQTRKINLKGTSMENRNLFIRFSVLAALLLIGRLWKGATA